MPSARELPPFEVTVQVGPPLTLVTARGAVDLAQAPLLRTVLFDLIEKDHAIAVDLSAATLIDAQSVGVLVSAHRIAERTGSALWIRGVSDRVRRVLEICRVDHLCVLPEGLRQGAASLSGGADWTVEALLRARQRQPVDREVREGLRRSAIEHARPLAARLALRYRGCGESVDDLTQVAAIALINAIDRYDAERGTRFAAYAVPKIIGELKRHFRDNGWWIRVPRHVQEMRLELRPAVETLAQRLGREPTVAELAHQITATEQEVGLTMLALAAYRPDSLSTSLTGTDIDGGLADRIGATDPGFERVETQVCLQPLLAALPERQRRILALRFYGNQTQEQIAARMGISQVHVSRLLADALVRLREGLTDS
jgi:RNA polymerase sigma-B factor